MTHNRHDQGRWRSRVAKVVASLTLITLISGCSGGAPAQEDKAEFNWRWATGAAAGSARGDQERALADMIEEQSDGRISIEFGWGGALGSESVGLENAQYNAVQFSSASSSNASAIVSAYAALDLPFLFNGYEGLEEFLDSPEWDEITAQAEPSGLKFVGQVTEGFRQLLSVDGISVQKHEDLNHVRLRTTNSQIEAAYVSALSADPTVVAFNETYMALQQGTVDGYNAAYSTVVQYGMADVIGNVTEYNIVPIVSPIHMNLDAYESLPPDLQQVIDSVGNLATAQDLKKSESDNVKFKQTLEKQGTHVVAVDESALTEWRKAAEPVYARFTNLVPSEWLDKVQAEQDLIKVSQS